ncbi:MAG: inner-rane translocator [Marmoricola sp.]|jgi:ribose/xylose/arabinose/galactoside ABC-type transport system permease subunit|nr:inner-rane translocator [Marmoricola sp.]MDQ1665337.1 ribose transport system permease protein [Actinomycetota bacterium]
MATGIGTTTDDTEESNEVSWQRFALNENTLRALLLTGFLVVIIAYFTARDSSFLSTDNGLNILVNASVIGIVSLGQVLTVISGGFDLSVSGTVPLGAVIFAILVNDGWGVVGAAVATMAMGAVCGLVNGLIVAKARINPLIATLGTMSVTGGLALTIADGVQVPFDNPDDGVLAEQSLFGVNNHVWILVVLSIALFCVLRFTVYGRYLYSVGGNREAARLGGIRVDAVTISVYVVSAALATLAGAVLASQLLTGSGTAGTDSGLQSIAAVILGGASLAGGVGGVPGTLIGVLILGTLANGMAILSVPAFYQTITTGLVLLLAVGVSQVRRLRVGR